jgi:hypothetical protein
VVTFCKCPIDSITNSDIVSSHSHFTVFSMLSFIYSHPVSICATCPANLILIDVIILVTIDEEYKLRSSSLCDMIKPPVTSSPVYTSTPVSRSQTCSVRRGNKARVPHSSVLRENYASSETSSRNAFVSLFVRELISGVRGRRISGH